MEWSVTGLHLGFLGSCHSYYVHPMGIWGRDGKETVRENLGRFLVEVTVSWFLVHTFVGLGWFLDATNRLGRIDFASTGISLST